MYRDYPQSDVEQINVIICLKAAQLSLKDIQAVIQLMNQSPTTACKNDTLQFVSNQRTKFQKMAIFYESLNKIAAQIEKSTRENNFNQVNNLIRKLVEINVERD